MKSAVTVPGGGETGGGPVGGEINGGPGGVEVYGPVRFFLLSGITPCRNPLTDSRTW
jgi:hypothetical protein